MFAVICFFTTRTDISFLPDLGGGEVKSVVIVFSFDLFSSAISSMFGMIDSLKRYLHLLFF